MSAGEKMRGKEVMGHVQGPRRAHLSGQRGCGCEWGEALLSDQGGMGMQQGGQSMLGIEDVGNAGLTEKRRKECNEI